MIRKLKSGMYRVYFGTGFGLGDFRNRHEAYKCVQALRSFKGRWF